MVAEGNASSPPDGEGAALALDMEDGRDRNTLKAGIAQGWALSPEKLARYAQALDAALGLALQSKDARGIRSCVQTMAVLVAQVQREEERDLPTGSDLVVRVEFEKK